MLILLPPSEGKRPGGDGPPVDLDGLSWPSLNQHRRRVGDVLSRICQRQPRKARELLGLSEALDDDRAANVELWTSPSMLAGHRYAGVVHAALDYPSLTAVARRRADRSVVTFSGLWGATRPSDLIPAYRIGIHTVLPRIGTLAAFWRPHTVAALDEDIAEHGAIDLRSGDYVAMYRPTPATAERIVNVRLLRADGARAASSYASKAAKGILSRHMLLSGSISVNGLLAAASDTGFTAGEIDRGVEILVSDNWPPTPIVLP